MAEPCLSFPVRCLNCGAEGLCGMPVATLAAALLNGAYIELHSACHGLRWSADAVQIQQLREYLATVAVISVERVYQPDSRGEVMPPLARPAVHTGKQDAD
jgi:hypothetical protein